VHRDYAGYLLNLHIYLLGVLVDQRALENPRSPGDGHPVLLAVLRSAEDVKDLGSS
jgi:hypothetical protein